MSLDTVDVVHELEDALGAAAWNATTIADTLGRVIAAILTRGATRKTMEELLAVQGAILALATSAKQTTAPGSAIAEWREEGEL